MTKSVEFQVSGDLAMFTDPIIRIGGDKCSYPVPTYEALKGVLKSIYWQPTFTWVIDEVRVMNPISPLSQGALPLIYSGGYDLASYTYLEDCCYQVRAHIEWNRNRPEFKGDRNYGKHYSIANRSIERGGYRMPFLGTSECMAMVDPCTFGEGRGAYDDRPEISFGLMFHGFTYPDESYSEETKGRLTARFWRPVMKNGVIKFCRPEECTAVKDLGPYSMKSFGKSDAC